MPKYCRKCGGQLKGNELDCPNCGYVLNDHNNIHGKKSNTTRMIGGFFIVIVAVTICYMGYYMNLIGGNKQITPINTNVNNLVSDETKNIKGDNEQDDNVKDNDKDKDNKVKNIENLKESTGEIEKETKVNDGKNEMKYKIFKDGMYKFQIDYPEIKEQPNDAYAQKLKFGQAVRYRENIGKDCYIIFGNFFCTIGENFDIYRIMKADKLENYKDISDLKTTLIDDSSYEISYEYGGVHYFKKDFFGKQGGLGQDQYVQLVYSDNSDNIDVALKMYNSFKPGVEPVK